MIVIFDLFVLRKVKVKVSPVNMELKVVDRLKTGFTA